LAGTGHYIIGLDSLLKHEKEFNFPKTMPTKIDPYLGIYKYILQIIVTMPIISLYTNVGSTTNLKCIIYVNTTLGKTKYRPLILALLEKITETQYERIVRRKKGAKDLIISRDLFNCFWYDKKKDFVVEYATQECSCGKENIKYCYVIFNKENKENYILGSVCIKTWGIGTGNPHILGLIERNIARINDTAEDTRCYFCNRKTTTNKCRNCTYRSLVKIMIDKWRSVVNRRRRIKKRVVSQWKMVNFYYDIIVVRNIRKWIKKWRSQFKFCAKCAVRIVEPYKLCYKCNIKDKDTCKCGGLKDKKFPTCYNCNKARKLATCG
jgi:hypothetical protein